ncbi:XRE family transcriptional regulator, partial [Parabacteroides sp. OttesenSCG-928-J18]|nr:XRE family transcriptional regulator [Parabacteroides sp. OttesenSCG-928-J18]
NALYCKIERGDRLAKREQVVKLAELFHVNPNELLVLWLADRVVEALKSENELANDVIDVVKRCIK